MLSSCLVRTNPQPQFQPRPKWLSRPLRNFDTLVSILSFQNSGSPQGSYSSIWGRLCASLQQVIFVRASLELGKHKGSNIQIYMYQTTDVTYGIPRFAYILDH